MFAHVTSVAWYRNYLHNLYNHHITIDAAHYLHKYVHFNILHICIVSSFIYCIFEFILHLSTIYPAWEAN